MKRHKYNVLDPPQRSHFWYAPQAFCPLARHPPV